MGAASRSILLLIMRVGGFTSTFYTGVSKRQSVFSLWSYIALSTVGSCSFCTSDAAHDVLEKYVCFIFVAALIPVEVITAY